MNQLENGHHSLYAYQSQFKHLTPPTTTGRLPDIGSVCISVDREAPKLFLCILISYRTPIADLLLLEALWNQFFLNDMF